MARENVGGEPLTAKLTEPAKNNSSVSSISHQLGEDRPRACYIQPAAHDRRNGMMSGLRLCDHTRTHFNPEKSDGNLQMR